MLGLLLMLMLMLRLPARTIVDDANSQFFQ